MTSLRLLAVLLALIGLTTAITCYYGYREKQIFPCQLYMHAIFKTFVRKMSASPMKKMAIRFVAAAMISAILRRYW
ncbi:hypothetical protein NECAME_02605 [Necator americanus]|uniref:Uncharacterized protein n=1 Tax=Necator americanus TaxID=51031 RepID=W2TEP9_NECAM|nr:hypothetical protein NECAME_02605 [Necator americanus]ETN79487.1 hypothetical protein NECAME_02605 [Necator americanus]